MTSSNTVSSLSYFASRESVQHKYTCDYYCCCYHHGTNITSRYPSLKNQHGCDMDRLYTLELVCKVKKDLLSSKTKWGEFWRQSSLGKIRSKKPKCSSCQKISSCDHLNGSTWNLCTWKEQSSWQYNISLILQSRKKHKKKISSGFNIIIGKPEYRLGDRQANTAPQLIR